jgi:Helix-turn-helix domain
LPTNASRRRPYRIRLTPCHGARWTANRNAKARLTTLARALSHPTEKGKHYGVLTDKFLSVLNALLWGFHNAASGRCFPSYESIAERAHCNRDTVYQAIHALEAAGILTWVNRIKRVREWVGDLFGRAQSRTRVVRTSNAYTFNDPKPAAKPPD